MAVQHSQAMQQWRPVSKTKHCVASQPTHSRSFQRRVLAANQATRLTITKPGIQRVQALADISRSALCCHSNETHALQIRTMVHQTAPPTIPQVTSGSVQVVWECGNEQTDRQTAVTNIHFASATPHAKCKYTPKTTSPTLGMKGTHPQYFT